MAYMQITTKCNMLCAHCCYSCNKNGKHMDWYTAVDAITFIRDNLGNESISIGGGEPTLHPRFFDILRICLNDFDYVWLATNGSQTKKMWRLQKILDGEDYPEDIDPDNEEAYERALEKYDSIYQKDKLSVALSQDYFHSPIDDRIVDYWTRRAGKHGASRGYEIRNVTNSHKGLIKAGRAAKTGNWQDEDGCVCADVMIKPNGDIKLCGCSDAPLIGNVRTGIEGRWEEVMQIDGYLNCNCYKGLKEKKG